MPDEFTCWNGKDLVQLFEGELLGFSDETEDHEPGDKIEPSVETEGSSWSHYVLHSREGQAENASESVVDANGPSHSLLTLNRRKHFGRILESDRSFTQRVGDCEEVHEQNHWSYFFATAARRFQQRQPGSQQENAHEGKGSQS